MKIKVENFQSISKAEIEVKGLTIITGQNNTGKSAMARAVMGAFTNLRGNSFVRQGTQIAKVELSFDDGNHLIWSKGKNTNQYEINGKLIQKVGSDVPDEILNLGVKAVEVDAKEIHPQFAKQFQQVFLIDLPPSSLASALSDVDVIQKLEQSTALLRTDIKNTNLLNNSKREEFNKEKVRLEKFDGLEDIETLSHKIELLEIEIEGLESKLLTLREIRDRKNKLENLIKILAGLSDILFQDVDILPICQKIEESEKLKQKRDVLVSFLELKNDLDSITFNDLNIDLAGLATQLKEMEKLSKVKRVLTKVIDLKEDIENTSLSHISIESIIDRLSILEIQKNQRKGLLEMLNHQIDLNSISFTNFDLSMVDRLENLIVLKRQRTKIKILNSILEVGLKNVKLSNLESISLKEEPLIEIKKQKENLSKELDLINNDLKEVMQDLEYLNAQIGDTCPLCQSVCGSVHL